MGRGVADPHNIPEQTHRAPGENLNLSVGPKEHSRGKESHWSVELRGGVQRHYPRVDPGRPSLELMGRQKKIGDHHDSEGRDRPCDNDDEALVHLVFPAVDGPID